MKKNPRVILTVTNDLITDQRVHKVATSLQKAGYQINLVGCRWRSTPSLQRPYKYHRIRLLFRKTVLFYAGFNIRLFLYLLFQPVDILVANDLDTLLPNYLVARIRRKKLVYDSHEYFTQVPELIDRPAVQKVWLFIEQFILPKIRHGYTVCQSIADIYHQKYGIDLAVVRNIPIIQEFNDNQNLKIPDHLQNETRPIIIYQGFLNKGRGLEALISAMKYLTDYLLLILGSGLLEESLKNHSKNEHVSDRVIFTGRIPFKKVKQYTRLASLGVSLEENIGLNYYFALPNKIFDYIRSEIPVLVSNLPEMRRIVENWEVGQWIDSHDPKYLADKIKQMITDQKQRSEWEKNLKIAAKELSWEQEEQYLLAVYQEVSAEL